MNIDAVLIGAAGILGSEVAKESAKRAVAAGWESLTQAIKRQFGRADHPVPVLIERLPGVVDDPAQTRRILEAVATMGVQWDTQVMEAIQHLADTLQAQQPQGGNISAQIQQIDGGVGVAYNSHVTITNSSRER